VIRSSFIRVPTGSFNALNLNSRSKMSSLRIAYRYPSATR
jgi:hypothetical protein